MPAAALPCFLGLSAAAHALVFGLWLWLAPLSAPPDRLRIHEIDFLPGPTRVQGGGGAGGAPPRSTPAAPAPVRRAAASPPAPRAAVSPVDVPAPKSLHAAPPPLPAPTPVEAAPTETPPPAGELTRSIVGDATGSRIASAPISGPGSAGAGTGAGGGIGAGRGRGRGDGTGSVDMGDPDFSEYFQAIKDAVYAAWRYPPGVSGTHRLSLSFALGRDGVLQAVRVLSSSHAALNDSAVAAMRRASPFAPMPEQVRRLAGEPLTLVFTVTVR
jgi:protein TonB